MSDNSMRVSAGTHSIRTVRLFSTGCGDSEPCDSPRRRPPRGTRKTGLRALAARGAAADRKSTRLNSSHLGISYAGFCLEKSEPAFRSEAPKPRGHEAHGVPGLHRR